ncbi:hypothetical protein GEV33_008892 [Tenebrio molitor]|uniref:Uncharacterized protein n=1 Tax=Tenebrio molitor TaxID=7067 RepID=A0A8J6HGD4_TENMO|nr:hypothetical protein GEV33_008892 [Tenebrio molitor]
MVKVWRPMKRPRVNPDSNGPSKSLTSDTGDYNERRAAVGNALTLHADRHLKTIVYFKPSCLFLVTLTTATHIPVKITSGAYWRPLPDTIPYEASIPLTYKTPWNHLDIYPTVPVARRPPASFCANNPSRPTCQMGELLSQLNQQFVEHMGLLEPSLNPLVFAKLNKSEVVEDYDYDDMEQPVNRTKRALDFIGAGLSWCCGVATQRKLDSLVTDEHAFRSQLDLLNKGLRRNLQVLEIARYNIEHDNIVYKNQADTSRDFQRTHFFIFENSRRTLHLFKFFRDSLIMQDSADVTRLEGTVQGSQRKLAIPLSELSRYYKLDLADCTLVGQKLIIEERVRGGAFGLGSLVREVRSVRDWCGGVEGPKRVRLEEESRKSKPRRRGADLRIPDGRFVKNQTPECGVKFHARISSSTVGPRKPRGKSRSPETSTAP